MCAADRRRRSCRRTARRAGSRGPAPPSRSGRSSVELMIRAMSATTWARWAWACVSSWRRAFSSATPASEASAAGSRPRTRRRPRVPDGGATSAPRATPLTSSGAAITDRWVSRSTSARFSGGRWIAGSRRMSAVQTARASATARPATPSPSRSGGSACTPGRRGPAAWVQRSSPLAGSSWKRPPSRRRSAAGRASRMIGDRRLQAVGCQDGLTDVEDEFGGQRRLHGSTRDPPPSPVNAPRVG